MTGVVAVIAHDRRCQVSETEIELLAAIYESLRGSGQRHGACAGAYARLIKIDTATADRPGIEVQAGNWAAASGKVYPSGSLLGTDPTDLDGQFAVIAYDRAVDTLKVAVDPLGLHAFYMAERDGKTYVSNSALTLAKHLRAKPNHLALAMFLCCGTQHGSITNWEGIERLEPATLLVFAPEGRSRSRYWRLEIDETVQRLSFEQSVDHTIESLTATFSRYLAAQPRVWSDLTGGYDTRLLTLLLANAGIDFHTNTYGTPNVPDVRFGRRAARAAGWDWTHFRVPETWAEMAPTYVPPALAWADGRLSIVHLAQVLWTQERKSQLYATAFTGGGGELFRGHAWRQEIFGAGRPTQVNFEALVRLTLVDADTASLLTGTLSGEVLEYLRSVLAAQAQPYSSEPKYVQLDILLASRKPLWDGIFGSASGAFLRSDQPFLFKPAFSLGFSLQYRHRLHRKLVRAVIERLNPRVAAVPTTNGGPAQPQRLTNIHHFAPYYTNFGRMVVDKVSRKVVGSSLLALPVQEDPRLAAGRIAILRHLGLTPETMVSAPLYKGQSLATLLQEAKLPTFTRADLLGRAITVELAMRAGNETCLV